MQRADLLVEAGVDLIVVDTAHGHSKGVIDAVRNAKKRHPNLQVVAGNIATADGDLGADRSRRGRGEGGHRARQHLHHAHRGRHRRALITAIADCVKVADQHDARHRRRRREVGDVEQGHRAAGASCVMIGSLFAGTDESPGELVLYQGRSRLLGMGSMGDEARQQDRYGQAGTADEKLVPEGIEGRVLHRGSLRSVIDQLVGGLRACGMASTGSRDIQDMRKNAKFVRITNAGLRESHVHDDHCRRGAELLGLSRRAVPSPPTPASPSPTPDVPCGAHRARGGGPRQGTDRLRALFAQPGQLGDQTRHAAARNAASTSRNWTPERPTLKRKADLLGPERTKVTVIAGVLLAANHRKLRHVHGAHAPAPPRGLVAPRVLPGALGVPVRPPFGVLINALASAMSMYPPVYRETEKRGATALARLLGGRAPSWPTVVGIHLEGTRNKGDDPTIPCRRSRASVAWCSRRGRSCCPSSSTA
ncbi:MAG: IMP dehydrogenase [Polyangiaceae bacterium]